LLAVGAIPGPSEEGDAMTGEENEQNEQIEALGAAIRAQRKLANLSLRQLAGIAEISNPYLSQIERGLHAPSVHVLRSIANALSLSAETLQEQAGVIGDELWPQSTARAAEATELAVRRDPSLTDEQKAALLAVYRSYRDANFRRGAPGEGETAASGESEPARSAAATPGARAGRRPAKQSPSRPRSRPQRAKKAGS
jgi:transcriptional regulator with XRE-family HTH domain